MYHKYVFDIQKRKFIGDFESMYKNEDKENFDSWFQENHNHLSREISLAILKQYNFESILDIGCGKGNFTHLLKKKNNNVIGIDISKTAIEKAKSKFPEIDFLSFDISDISYFEEFLKKYKTQNYFEIVLLIEILSYLKNWAEILHILKEYTKYIFISLYIPKDPIGYVKSKNILVKELKKNYRILEYIYIYTKECCLIFAEVK